jgi:hypothetical protein
MTLHEQMLLLHAIASETPPEQIVEPADAASAPTDAGTVELYMLMEDDLRASRRRRAT